MKVAEAGKGLTLAILGKLMPSSHTVAAAGKEPHLLLNYHAAISSRKPSTNLSGDGKEDHNSLRLGF